MPASRRYRRMAKSSAGARAAGRSRAAAPVSDLRRRPRSFATSSASLPWYSSAGICPRPRARPSVIAFSARAPCVPARWRCHRRRARRGSGRCARPTSTAASVWQTMHARANSSRPFCFRRSGARRRPPRSPCLAVECEHERGHDQAEREHHHDPSVTRRWPSFDSVCSDGARRAARRASPRRTRRSRERARRPQRKSMEARTYRVAPPNGRASLERRVRGSPGRLRALDMRALPPLGAPKAGR